MKGFGRFVFFFAVIIFTLSIATQSFAADARIVSRHFTIGKETVQVYIGFQFTVPNISGLRIYRCNFDNWSGEWQLLQPGDLTPWDGVYRIKSIVNTLVFTLTGPVNPNHDYEGSATLFPIAPEMVNLFLSGQWQMKLVVDPTYDYYVGYVAPNNMMFLGQFRDGLNFVPHVGMPVEFTTPNSKGFLSNKFLTLDGTYILHDLEIIIARVKRSI